MVNVKGERMFKSSLFLSVSFFCLFLLAPPKKAKDLASQTLGPPLMWIQAYPTVGTYFPALFLQVFSDLSSDV